MRVSDDASSGYNRLGSVDQSVLLYFKWLYLVSFDHHISPVLGCNLHKSASLRRQQYRGQEHQSHQSLRGHHDALAYPPKHSEGSLHIYQGNSHQASIFLFVFSLIQVNFINLSKFLFRYISQKFDHLFFGYLISYKLLVLLIMLMLVFCVIIPQKLKIPSIISFIFILIILLSLFIKTCTMNFENTSDVSAFATTHWSALIGNVLYSVEGISSVFTIRSSMEVPSRMSSVVLTAGAEDQFDHFVLHHAHQRIHLLFCKFNQSYSKPLELPFFYYPTSIFIFILEVFFYLNIPSLLMIFNLTALMTLESIPFISAKLRDEKGRTKLWNIYIFRIIGTVVLFFPGFFNFNEYFILILSGSFLGPIIFFILPVKVTRYSATLHTTLRAIRRREK